MMLFRKRWSFGRLSLNARLAVVVAVVIVGLVSLTTMSTLENRDRQMGGLEYSLKSQVESAISIAENFHERAAKGEFSEAKAQQLALAQIQNMRWDGGAGYVFAFDTDMVLRMHPLLLGKVGKSVRNVTDRNGLHVFQMMGAVDLQKGHGLTRYDWPKPTTKAIVGKISYSQLFKPWNMNFATGAYFDDIDAAFRHSLIVNLGKAGLVGLLVILMVWFSMRSIRQSIGGEPGFAVEMAMRIADGDLSTKDSGKVFASGSLLDALARMRIKLTSTVGDVQRGSESVSAAAQQIAKGNDNLSQRTQEQASSLEETAASMEEMTSTVKQNAEHASHANQLACSARDQATRGGEVVGEAVVAMGEINESSHKIADIVGLIQEIAFQTNLLALNAAVEAARAGEQGRGFAVVASEVRSLAQRSADAAKEIKGLIESSAERVRSGSELVDRSGKALADIVDSVKKVTDIVAEIAAATQEQSAGIEQVNNAVMQMDEVTQQNAALVEEASAAARAMQERADALQRQMAFFHLGDGSVPMLPSRGVVPQAIPAQGMPAERITPVKSVAKAGGAWTEF